MEYDAHSCPPAVIEKVEQVDLASEENDALFSWIAKESSLECQIHSLVAISRRINALSHRLVVSDFCSSAATYARFLKKEDVQAIKQAYHRFPYDETIAASYFLGLRANQIDIRERFASQFVENWLFSSPFQDAATWHYYLYLASFDDPDALEKIAKKLSNTESGNDLTVLLRSLDEVKTEAVTGLLKHYQSDTRRADDPEKEGGGPMVGETVGIMLMVREP